MNYGSDSVKQDAQQEEAVLRQAEIGQSYLNSPTLPPYLVNGGEIPLGIFFDQLCDVGNQG